MHNLNKKMKGEILKMENNAKGITLISLVITIIVLLILAGVTINLTLGENGIFRVAEQAARNYKDAEEKELWLLDQFSVELGTNFEYSATEGVNKPKILDGMTPIKFTTPVGTTKGETVITNENDTEWYSYANKQWANAQTQDGSMWVWIPRYAYRMVYNDANDKSAGGTVDVVFLIGDTDTYYDANGNIQTAKRAKSADEVVDTTTGYTVHPAFTDESSINYANGGWDKELTGIWVAKFEAAYADGDVSADKRTNSAPVRASSVKYTQKQAWGSGTENGSNDGWMTARNYKDGEYAIHNGNEYEWKDGVQTSIKYPTFQPLSYAMNYISSSDAYSVSRVLTENRITTNIYGLKDSNTDSHLMKNSEWGAVAYLSKSSYGLKEVNIFINNANLNNSTQSVYAVTGCCGVTADAIAETTTKAEIDVGTSNIYIWNQVDGQAASTTGNLYGVYDMSGATTERVSGYIANGHGNLKENGASIAYNVGILKIVSTKYTTAYPYDSSIDFVGTSSGLDEASEANYFENTRIYGDAIKETSNLGIDSKSWNNDCSYFISRYYPLPIRGGFYGKGSGAGVTSFERTDGAANYLSGFRAVLCAL